MSRLLIDKYPSTVLEPEADLAALADTIEDTLRAAKDKMQSLVDEDCHPDSWPADTPAELEAAAAALERAVKAIEAYVFPNGKHAWMSRP